jgi:hypothetical protein
MKSGRLDTIGDLITDEMLDAYAVIAPWDEMADRLVERYGDTAARVVMYLGEAAIRADDNHLAQWGEVATAVRSA